MMLTAIQGRNGIARPARTLGRRAVIKRKTGKKIALKRRSVATPASAPAATGCLGAASSDSRITARQARSGEAWKAPWMKQGLARKKSHARQLAVRERSIESRRMPAAVATAV